MECISMNLDKLDNISEDYTEAFTQIGEVINLLTIYCPHIENHPIFMKAKNEFEKWKENFEDSTECIMRYDKIVQILCRGTYV